MTKREVAKLPDSVMRFSRVGRPWKTSPDGWEELPGGIHLGSGVWLVSYRRTEEATPMNHPPAPTPEQRKRWVEMCQWEQQRHERAAWKWEPAEKDAAEWAALADYLSRGET